MVRPVRGPEINSNRCERDKKNFVIKVKDKAVSEQVGS